MLPNLLKSCFCTFVSVMVEAFQKYLSELVPSNETPSFLLAVSGGLDSVVMAEMFRRSGYNYGIAHCNFQLRGQESNGDENFVKELAAKARVPFFHIQFDTVTFCKDNKLSVQMGARQLRYEWFEQVRQENGFDYLVTAHHADDAIETFFINLLRGTGISGLHGIKARNEHIVRPLLKFYRKEMEEFATANQLKWRDDSSNNSDKYERNKIRHHLLPLLEKINPGAKESITSTIENLAKAELLLNDTIKKITYRFTNIEGERIRIPFTFFKEFTHSDIYLYEIIKEMGFNYAQCQQIVANSKGQPGQLFLSATHRLVIDREKLIIEPYSGPNNHFEIEINEATNELLLGKYKYIFNTVEKTADFQISTDARIAHLDFDKLKFPLKIRNWKEGDRFYPLGMDKPKKISDFLVDNKVSLPDKEHVYVLVSGNEIAWLIGYRPDERFKVTKGTKKVYLCKS